MKTCSKYKVVLQTSYNTEATCLDLVHILIKRLTESDNDNTMTLYKY